MNAQTTKKRWRFQFHLSTAVVLLLVIGFMIPMLGYCYRRYGRNDSSISVRGWNSERIVSLSCKIRDEFGVITFEDRATSPQVPNLELKVPACRDAELTVTWEHDGKAYTNTIICSAEPNHPADILAMDDGTLSDLDTWLKCQ